MSAILMRKFPAGPLTPSEWRRSYESKRSLWEGGSRLSLDIVPPEKIFEIENPVDTEASLPIPLPRTRKKKTECIVTDQPEDPNTMFHQHGIYGGASPQIRQPRRPPSRQFNLGTPLNNPSPLLYPNNGYYYYGAGSNPSSTIDSHTGLDNLHNLSQDSGLSPSPLEPQPSYRQYNGVQTGVYDNYRPGSSAGNVDVPSKSNRWGIPDFLRKKSQPKEEDLPPPLPPKKPTNTNIFKPTLLVKSPSVDPHEMMSTPNRSWRQERERTMLKVEAQRNSLVLSSDEENEFESIRREVCPNTSLQYRRTPIQHETYQQQHMHDQSRLSYVEQCHIPEMKEPFPAELDFSQITRHSDYDPSLPPPPPPRDPHRRSLLLQGSSPIGRPVSYSFENLSLQRIHKSPVPEPPDLGLPVAKPIRPYQPNSQYLNKKMSASELHLFRVGCDDSSSVSSNMNGSLQTSPFEMSTPRRRGIRSASVSATSRTQLLHNPGLVNNFHSPLPDQQPRREIWKSPPPPFVPCPEPSYYTENLAPPMRPKSQWRNQGFEDPILLLQGKSSPSSGSLTSRDSGCSEPTRTTPLASSEPHACQQPLPVVAEKSESVEREPISDENSSVVFEQRRASLPPSTACSSSSPTRSRSGSDQPGFSCRKRRSLFRDAMCELEDAIKVIQSDVDLLDRAERRDLPTVHQELIIKSRIEEALGRKKKSSIGEETTTTSLNTSAEMAFSDMDNFMNWNTSSSFENLEEQGFPPATSTPRQRTPSRRRSAIPDKKLDDMAYRICKSNNRTPRSLADPVAVSGQSYLMLTPDFAQTLLGLSSIPNIFNDEPDPVVDDVHFRSLRDSRILTKVQEKQPKFGIPNGPIISSSNNDYLHAIPTGKYKSTFNAMKNPDTFQDDMAVRSLRKDDSKSEPELLGIFKDPNISAHSCWHHKLQERLTTRPTSPLVFRATKNSKLMQALSQRIAQTIRKQSNKPSAGNNEENIVTYDDLLRDPSLMRAMREALLQCTPEELEEMSRKPDWSGKTMFELFSGDCETEDGSKDYEGTTIVNSGLDSPHNDVIVGFCMLDQSEPVPKSEDQEKSGAGGISATLENDSTAFLRSLERGDSGEEEVKVGLSFKDMSEDPSELGFTTQQVLDKPSSTSEVCEYSLKSATEVARTPSGDRRRPTGSVSSNERRRRHSQQRHVHDDKMNHFEQMANTMESGSLPQSHERRLQKHKEDRRRQMASRLSSNRTSSSSSDNDDDTFRIGASGCESGGSGNGSGHFKYRRQRSKLQLEKDVGMASGSSPSDKIGVKQVRRRRRRSVTGGPGTSPSSSSRVEKGRGVQKTVICSEIETIADVHREDEHSIFFNEARWEKSRVKKSEESRNLQEISRSDQEKFSSMKPQDRELIEESRPTSLKHLKGSLTKEEICRNVISNQSSEEKEEWSSFQQNGLPSVGLSPPLQFTDYDATSSSTSSFNISKQRLDHLNQIDVLSSPLRRGNNSLAETDLQNDKKPSWSTIQHDAETIFLDEVLYSGWGESRKIPSTSNSKGKPPIFPSSEKISSCLTRQSLDFSRPSSREDETPAFLKEFNARRRSSNGSLPTTFNPNETAPASTPTKRCKVPSFLPSRPQSAFILRTNIWSPQKRPTIGPEPDTNSSYRPGQPYEYVSENKIPASRVRMGGENRNPNESKTDEIINFDEAEVLQLCQDFLQDYDKSRQRRSLEMAAVDVSNSEQNQKIKTNPDIFVRPSLRTRSSSLTLLDCRSNEDQQLDKLNVCLMVDIPPIFPKPILKKSGEDLKPIPILKNRCEVDAVTIASLTGSSAGSVAGGILKRKSVMDSYNETTGPRPDHVRIRSPSQEVYGGVDEDSERPMSRRPILRSRKTSASVEERPSSPEYPQSILKRRSSQEDLDDCSAATSGANSRSSPEPPHSILKRKLSIGSLGSHSPEGSLGSVSSILRKKSYSQHSSYQGSLEDLSGEGEKIRSILKKRSTVSTDDEQIDNVSDRPKSILKGRQSEESLSPQSDPNEIEKLGKSYRDQETVIRPILKQRDSRDELSGSNEEKDNPISQPESSEVSGSPGSTPVRRASVPYAPKFKRASACETPEADQRRSFSAARASLIFDGQDPRSNQRATRVSPTYGNVEVQTEGSSNILSGLREESQSETETGSSSAISLPRRTIVKHDSLELISDVARVRGAVNTESGENNDNSRSKLNNGSTESTSVGPRRSELWSCTSSSEDLDSTFGPNRAFSGVVIDPVPGGNKINSQDIGDIRQNDPLSDNDLKTLRKSPVKPRKNSLQPQRQSVIPPSSVKITSDANLAIQLDSLADRAAAEIKKQRDQLTMLNPNEESSVSADQTLKYIPIAISEKRCLRRFPPKSLTAQRSLDSVTRHLPWAPRMIRSSGKRFQL